jgi:hypothetical protein
MTTAVIYQALTAKQNYFERNEYNTFYIIISKQQCVVNNMKKNGIGSIS